MKIHLVYHGHVPQDDKFPRFVRRPRRRNECCFSRTIVSSTFMSSANNMNTALGTRVDSIQRVVSDLPAILFWHYFTRTMFNQLFPILLLLKVDGNPIAEMLNWLTHVLLKTCVASAWSLQADSFCFWTSNFIRLTSHPPWNSLTLKETTAFQIIDKHCWCQSVQQLVPFHCKNRG